MKLKSVKAYAIVSPFKGEHIECYGLSTSPGVVRRAAIRIGHVYGGKAEGETWAALRKQGYRIVPVVVSERRK